MSVKMHHAMILFSLLWLSACPSTGGEAVQEEQSYSVLEVYLQIPDELAVNDEAELKLLLTQGEGRVTDADEVEFEIWKAHDREERDWEEAEHEGEGIYAVNRTVEE